MQEIILFNYAMSPFSEKVRAMLGYAGLSWQSVTVREMPPRKVVDILAGGYRKIPVAQIGADVFCDSRSIADEIARMSGKPELSLANQPKEVLDFVRTTDLETFFACVIAASDKRLLKKLIKQSSLWNAFLFLKDRIAMGKSSRVRAARGPKAKQAVLEHFARMEDMLTEDFLFGNTPNVADFAAYHSAWFVCELAEKPWLRDYPKVRAWLDRMMAFGHGEHRSLKANEALDIAKAASPRAVDSTSDDPLLGQKVSVAPDDYGRDPVIGTLVSINEASAVVARNHKRVGDVHVHFPRQGFAIEPA